MKATPGPSQGEAETFNRDEYADILDDGERPTEHWDPNAVVAPGGKTMAEALADLRAGKQISLGAPRDESVVTEQYQRTLVQNHHNQAPPPDAYALDDAADWKPNRNNQMIVGGLIIFATGIVLLYFLIN